MISMKNIIHTHDFGRPEKKLNYWQAYNNVVLDNMKNNRKVIETTKKKLQTFSISNANMNF